VVGEESFYGFAIFVIEGYGVDFYEDFSWAGEWDGFRGEGEVGDSVEGGLPLPAWKRF